jgi:hypothetical protein
MSPFGLLYFECGNDAWFNLSRFGEGMAVWFLLDGCAWNARGRGGKANVILSGVSP